MLCLVAVVCVAICSLTALPMLLRYRTDLDIHFIALAGSFSLAYLVYCSYLVIRLKHKTGIWWRLPVGGTIMLLSNLLVVIVMLLGMWLTGISYYSHFGHNHYVAWPSNPLIFLLILLPVSMVLMLGWQTTNLVFGLRIYYTKPLLAWVKLFGVTSIAMTIMAIVAWLLFEPNSHNTSGNIDITHDITEWQRCIWILITSLVTTTWCGYVLIGQNQHLIKQDACTATSNSPNQKDSVAGSHTTDD